MVEDAGIARDAINRLATLLAKSGVTPEEIRDVASKTGPARTGTSERAMQSARGWKGADAPIERENSSRSSCGAVTALALLFGKSLAGGAGFKVQTKMGPQRSSETLSDGRSSSEELSRALLH